MVEKLLKLELFFLFVFSIVLGVYFFILQNPKIKSDPELIKNFPKQSPVFPPKKDKIGFLPHWQINNSINIEGLTEIIYFSLNVTSDGHIARIADPGNIKWENDNATALKNRIRSLNKKFTLTVAAQNNDVIESFLDEETFQNNLVTDVASEIENNNLDGINLDIEYVGLPDDKYRSKFVTFVKKFTSALRKTKPDIFLSIDVYPTAIRKPKLFDIARLAPYFNRMIVMSYDYYTPTAKTAGPTSPIFGYKEKNYYYDAKTAFAAFSEIVPKEKLVMGIPLYGYEWPVEKGSKPLSRNLAEPYDGVGVGIVSIKRAQKEKQFNDPEKCSFDKPSQQPWCFWTEADGEERQAWFENEKSVLAKIKFASDLNLAGTAFWALGYADELP